jgi:hypothetical protein
MATMISYFRRYGWIGAVLELLLLARLGGAVQAGDKAAPPGGDPAGIEFFEKRIRPILVEHCYECHSDKAPKIKGDLRLDSRDGLLKGGRSGPAVVPGKPAESLLIKGVHYDDETFKMPPKAKLSAAQIADLEAWVKMGAPDPRTGGPAAKAIDFDKARNFWSFRPLQNPAPPDVKDPTWPANAVDRFILAKWEEKGLRPVPPVDKLALLRRATYDLTGLPPTPEEIEAFVKDKSPDAFAKVVDRLLASPAYGERWGRHWLDVVRYSDTAGDNSDFPVPQLYRYRNWVIDALNRDMPYDEFVRQQIAGDLMPATSAADRHAKLIATGYLANSRRHGSYEDARYPWHLTIEDTIDNVGKAILGLSMSCARCHDHKFDPLTAEDYYALYGFFSSTRYPWPGIELDRVPKDLVPLAPPAEAAQVLKERQEALAALDRVIKQHEADKAALEKKLKTADQETLATLRKQVDAQAKLIATAKKDRDAFAKKPLPFELAYAVIDGPTEPKKRIGQVGNAYVQIKGEPELKGKEVGRGFPKILGGQTLSAEVKGSGRLELARWLTDPANPLTARVMVNRIWQYHFGRGLVATPNDFGKQGRPPTHPELLDYLARRFIDSGWSLKAMHRLLMLSRTYQLGSGDDDANARIDVANDYLWHFPRRRLDAESIRDTILAVSGALDRSQGGPHAFAHPTAWDYTQHKPFKAVYETNRRSVYLMTQRIQRHPFLALFDGPDSNASTAGRITSTTSLQALFLMNDPFVHEQARKFAARLLAERADAGERIERAFLLAFGRLATADERQQVREYLLRVQEALATAGVPAPERPVRAWESLARVVFMSNEFVYVQ